MSCEVASLLEASECLCSLTRDQQAMVQIYLLCLIVQNTP